VDVGPLVRLRLRFARRSRAFVGLPHHPRCRFWRRGSRTRGAASASAASASVVSATATSARHDAPEPPPTAVKTEGGSSVRRFRGNHPTRRLDRLEDETDSSRGPFTDEGAATPTR
jgi:hypothetical protein